MGKIAFLFAGQGAQYPGMGKSLYETSNAAAKIFEQNEELLPGLMKDCFEADAVRLAQTDVTQPCVYTVDMAAAAALTQAGIRPQGVAGFSLGEMVALTFAQAFSAKQGIMLVNIRGALMQQAAESNPGSMAAILKLETKKVEDLCEEFQNIYPANYNCNGQIVVSGSAQEIPLFCERVKQEGGVGRTIAVGGAFHSPFMQQASDLFLHELQNAGMNKPKLPVYANTTGKPYGQDLCETLAGQIKSPVRWSDTILQMQTDGFDTFIEVGPGKTLSGFLKRIVSGVKVLQVQDAESLNKTLQELKQ